jgi:hypothetical protein
MRDGMQNTWLMSQGKPPCRRPVKNERVPPSLSRMALEQTRTVSVLHRSSERIECYCWSGPIISGLREHSKSTSQSQDPCFSISIQRTTSENHVPIS